ncbi:MAG TPA: hypothetical protein IAD02_00595 [Candidatus Enterousia intestinigallinarum]|uniref:Uncharacterized protein n=1 Tax=Candidatus Enterousia intestinigallinarum TaxID=2840790 RepID=A0A9D1FEW9_9PROT|nr:hypothetical protein [Candidatus Enterousia intestinigallinarum]
MNLAMWRSMDYLAKKMKLSCSGLAISGGLDATTFNKSKRASKYGQPRWLSMETIFKILKSSHTSIIEYAAILQMLIDEYDENNDN